MKTRFSLFILIFCVAQLSLARTNPFTHPTQTKTINKEFAASATAVMQVKNTYGNVTVVLWDENKINYEVKITVGAKKEKLTTELLDNITVNFTTKSNGVLAETVLPKSIAGNTEIEINYTIKIPRNAHAEIVQKYGNVAVPQLNGNLKLTCNYGSFILGQLHSKENEFNMAYISNAKAEYINYATFNMRYSTIAIDKINYLVSKGNYNTYKIKNAGTLNFETNYSTIHADKTQKVEISGNYLKLNFGEVLVSSILNSNYTTIKQNVNSQTEFIQYKGNYANVTIGNLNTPNFNFNISGNYLNLKTNMELNFTTKNTNGSTRQYIHVVENDKKLKVNVESNYGTVTLNK